MAEETYRNDQQLVLDLIIGNPPIINTHQVLGSLFEAFATAVSTFENNQPDHLMRMAYDALETRVKESRQQHAQTCMDNFNRHYQKRLAEIKGPSTSSGTDRRLPHIRRPSGRAPDHM